MEYMLVGAPFLPVSTSRKLPAAGSRHDPNDKSEPDNSRSNVCIIDESGNLRNNVCIIDFSISGVDEET